MNAWENCIKDGMPVPNAEKKLTDKQLQKVKDCFEKSDTDQSVNRIDEEAVSLERSMIWIIRRYIIGSGANIFYCLSIMAILYGVCGLIGPVL